MKAIRKSDGKVIEVREWRGASDVVYSDLDMNRFYQASDLDFNVEEAEEVTIDGWVAIDEAYGEAFLHEKKPVLKGQPIADSGDYDCVWHSDGKTYLLDAGLFPDMDCESEPRFVTITIKPKKQ